MALEGYHLYKARLRFTPIPQDVALGRAILPEGLLEVDPEMGETEVYRGHVDIRVPVLLVSSADRAVHTLVRHGIHSGVVNFGGDLRVIGPRPDGSPWEVGIYHPHHAG